MPQKRSKLSALLLLGLGLTGLQAQTSVNATGGNASGSGGTASYSVGQIVYTTNTGPNGSIAQGVQQPFEISVTTGIEDANGVNLMFAAHPNPTTENLQLTVDDNLSDNLSYQLLDLQGKLLETKKIESSETFILMRDLAPSTFFLKVIDGNKEIKTFKIIKN